MKKDEENVVEAVTVSPSQLNDSSSGHYVFTDKKTFDLCLDKLVHAGMSDADAKFYLYNLSLDGISTFGKQLSRVDTKVEEIKRKNLHVRIVKFLGALCGFGLFIFSPPLFYICACAWMLSS